MIFTDTGKTGNYLKYTSLCYNKEVDSIPLPMKTSNGEIIYSLHTSYLKIYTLPEGAQKAHIFTHLDKSLFLSIETLYNHGCIVVFDDKQVTISDKITGKYT